MCTLALSSRLLAVAVLAIGLALLGGCATPPRPEQMATQTTVGQAPAALLGKIAVGGVTGGKGTNPMLASEVGNGELREALRQSLQQAGYLSPDPDAATITLTVGVVGVDKPPGYSVTVTTLIRYVLANKEGGQHLFDELITTSCTRGLSDDLAGVTRLRHTEECAVRNNIAAFLTKLSASVLTDTTRAAPSDAPMSAGTFKFAPGPGPYSFVCNARSGYFNELNVAVPGDRVQVTGLIQVLTARRDAHYVATVNVAIKGAADVPMAGLRALVMPDTPNILDLAIKGSGGPRDLSVFASTRLTAAPIPFVLTFGDSGRLSVSAGGADASLPVEAFAMTRVNLSCSTAHVRFSNVAVSTLN